MKKILFVFSIMAVFVSCKNEKTEEKPVVAMEETAMNYQTFGDEITAQDVMDKSEMIEKYNDLKTGDTINVKFTTQVKEVCQKKGCWMKEIIAEGKAYVEEMSVEDQRHYAEDGGATPEEIAAITEPKRTLAFEAHGVLIPEEEKQ